MSITQIQSLIQDLRSGDRIRYHGVDWDIEDYSTYRDTEGYQTDEWLLKSSGGTEYYLLREYDPQQPSTSVTWYISNPVHNCRLLATGSKEDGIVESWDDFAENRTSFQWFQPQIQPAVMQSQENILPFLWGKMQTDDIPYPELQIFYKSYYFESRTQSKYESTDTTLCRITWDYWDQDHLTNLAIEAFPNGKIDIYLTKIVKLEEFSHIQKGVVKKSSNFNFNPDLLIESVMAVIILVVGVFMMIFG
jgi:hypothetical protein